MLLLYIFIGLVALALFDEFVLEPKRIDKAYDEWVADGNDPGDFEYDDGGDY